MKNSAKHAAKMVLLDSHALIHRAYHALPDFATTAGEPTGAIYGLSTMLLKLMGDFNPDYIIACYDRPEKTHRHDSYTDYKGTRKKLDDALITQLETSKEIFAALNIPLYELAGFEADDMLGTIVEQLQDGAHQADIDIIIASGDMDTLQLVKGEKVKVFTLKKGIKDTIVYDEKAVLTRFGFGPELIPDYKGLRGDPSDNIPGIAGIGEKTATILITTFGSLEEMYVALEKKGSEEVFKKVGISDRIYQLLKDGKEEALFSKMLATIRRDAPIEFKIPEKTFKEGVDIAKAEAIFKRFEFRTLAIKLKDVLDEKTVTSKGKKVASLSYDEEEIQGTDDKGYKIDAELPREIGILVSVIDSTVADPTYEDLYEVSGETDEKKAIEVLEKRVKEEGLQKIYDLELSLLPVLLKAEKIGVKIDVKYLKDLSKKYHKKLDTLIAEIYKHAGREFNIGSPKQLGEILFDTLNLTAKGMKKTAGGARSTKESELMKLMDSHPIIKLILEYRELSKLLSTYIDSIPKLVDKDGRLHTRFLQMGAATGRMASIDPNLQNIPIKSELGRAIRNAFIVEDGYCFAAFDYSQFELRIAAFLSGDEKLISIFKEGIDIHTAVSSQVFKVPLDEVTANMRRQAKVINFGILYGMGVNALRANLGSTKEEAQTFLEEYFKTYPTVADFLEKVKVITKDLGYTTTFFGRRRYFPDIKSKLPFMRASAERMAINAPIQGTLADITKAAMIKIDEYIVKEKLEDKVRLLLQVHDELDYEIHESVKNKVIPKIKEIMESVLTLEETKGVPIVANAEMGRSWGETEEV
jgi:DNA polymerase-1